MNDNELYAQYKSWQDANTPAPQENDPELYPTDADQFQRPPVDPGLSSAAAAVPRAIVRGVEDIGHTRHVLPAMAAAVRSWDTAVGWNPGRSVEEMILAWGQGDLGDAIVNKVGEDQASYENLRGQLAQRGLRLQAGTREFVEAVHAKMKDELGDNWRGRVDRGDEDSLISAAGLAVAVRKSTIPPELRAEYEGAVWSRIHDNLVAEVPEYQGNVHQLQQDVGYLENVLHGVTHASWNGLDIDTGVVKHWVEMLSGQPWDGSITSARAALEPALKKFHDMHAQGLEAEKWRRLGAPVDPGRMLEASPELRIAEVPFGQEAMYRFTEAQVNGVSYNDPYGQAWDNAHAGVRDTLATRPEEILGPLWKTLPAATPEELADQPVIGFSARQWWVEKDAAIRGEKDPARRYERFIDAVKSREAPPAMQQAYFDMLRTRHTEDVARQRAHILDMRSRRPDFDPEVAKAIEEQSYRDRAAQVAAQEHLEKAAEGSLIFRAVNWAQEAAMAIVEKTGLPALNAALVSPVMDVALNDAVYYGVDKGERRQMPQLGSVGDWVNRGLGAQGMAEEWTKKFADKVVSGQAGVLDSLFYTGAMIYSGFRSMPGFLADHPLEAVAVGHVLKGVHATRAPLAQALRDAKVPESLVALAELAVDPVSPGRAFNTLVGRTPEVVRTLGVSERTFIKALRRAPTEYAAKAERWANSYLSTAKRAGRIRDANIVDSAQAVYASLLARGQSGGRITRAEVRDFAGTLQDESPAAMRRAFAPFARHGESYDILLNIASMKEEAASLMEQEKALTNELGPLMEGSDVTPSRLFYEAYQSFHEGRLDQWKARLPKWMPAGVRDRVLNLVDRRINVGQSLPQLDPLAWVAASRLAEAQADSKSHQSLSRFVEAMVEEKRDVLAAEMLAKGMAAAAAKAAGAPDEALVPLLDGVRAAQAQDAALVELSRVAKTNRSIVEELASVSMTHQLGVQGPQIGKMRGLEDGHRSTLSDEQKLMVSGWLLDLANAAPEELGRLGLSRNVHTAARSAAEQFRKSTEESAVRHRAINWAVKALTGGDLAEAQKILRSARILVKQDEQSILGGINELRRRVHDVDSTRRETYATVLHRNLKDAKAWDIKALDTDLSEVVRAVREKVGEYAVAARGRPTAGLTDYLIDPAYITAGRLSGLVAQQVESSSHRLQILREQLDDDINQMPLEDQRTVSKLNTLHVSEWPDDLADNVRQVALRSADLQNRIINMAEQLGEITSEEAGRLYARGWDDRYYVSNAMRKEIEAAGMRIHDDELTQTTPLAQAAPLDRFRPQASMKYARFLYRDWGSGGAWTEKDFAVIEGQGGAGGALKRAQAFRDDLLKRGLVRKGDFHDPVPPMTSSVAALKGLVDSNSDFRLDTIRRMFTAVARRELFSQLGLMGGLVRRNLSDVPINQHGAWVRAVGREWGAMDGKLVHKSLIKQMNAWTNFSGVLEAIAKEGLSYSKELDPKISQTLETVGRQGAPGTWRERLDRLDTIIRHNKIMWNLKSWINNIMGNTMSSIFAGINPMSSDFWKGFAEYDELYDKLTITETKARVTRSAGGADVHTEFMDSSQFGFWQRSLDAPGEGVAITTRHRAEKRAKLSKLVNAYSVWEQAADRGMYELMHNKRMPAQMRTALKHNVEVYNEMGRRAYSEMMHEASKMGVLEALKKGEALDPKSSAWRSVLREMRDFVVDPDASIVRRAVASEYSRIDSKFKWAAYRYLRGRGLSVEAATERVAHYFQNFGAVHPVVRSLRRTPVVGSFVPGYPAEAARLGWNILRENPGSVLNFLTATGVWNSAALFSSGMMPSDAAQFGNDKTTLDFMRRMFFSLMVPTKDGIQSIDLSQFTSAAPFLQPSGVLAPAVEAGGDWLDRNLGPVSLPVQMMGNWLSSFVANTPISSSLTRYGMGVDPFSKELVYSNNTTGETVAMAGKEFLSYFTPATLVSWGSELMDYARGPVSLITKHNPSGLERAARGLSGVNIRTIKRSEAMARILLEHGGKGLAAQMYVEGLGADEMAYKAQVYKVREAPSEEELTRLFAEAKEMARAMTKKSVVVGGQRFDSSLSDEELTQKVIRDASADIYGTIERLPVDRLVVAARQLSAGIGRPTDPEMRHIWRCLTDPRYLSSKDDVGQLAETAASALEYADKAVDPYVKRQFERTAEAMQVRILQLKRSAATSRPVNLLRQKLGARPRYVLERMAKRLGL